jgi:DNA-binding IclR family transcriptional regulator
MPIKSVHVTFAVLRAFLGRRTALTLKEIAYQSGLPASKAHRYLQSLIQEGMVSQDPRTRLYRLGTAAIDFGLEALENSDPVVDACETVRQLSQQLDIGVSIDVLGPTGPICIWYGQPVTHFNAPVRLGDQQPLLTSAPGRVFLAFLPRHVTRPVVVAECERAAGDDQGCGDPVTGDPDGIAYEVRGAGYAEFRQAGRNGHLSLSAPVLDARGEACAAITFHIGHMADDDAQARLLTALLSAANDASAFKKFTTRLRFAEAR